ncbi:porin [Massilia atriviolacea]|uniref:Porin n=1 Tax=Massilia atriviolacea TaxID=2495579 RepID=A0A430HNA8_9BURK|nr:porin [Massilia atriviolacea]RSZ58981.1 porin [Massilia atriviolacea]
MKPSVLTLALAAALPAALAASGAAQAQSSVQVYGLIDAGVDYTTNANAAGDSATRVISGGKNTSRWGLRGTEDLGGGLKAVFGLEGGVLMDTGAADGALFKRQAYVGLDGSYGRVVIGRSFTTTYDFVILFDPLGYAPNYSWATSSNATGTSRYGMTTAFDNLVKYAGKSGDFKYGASIGLGEQAGSSADSRKYAVAGSWTRGGFAAMAAYEQINANTLAGTGRRDETTAFHAAVDYRNAAMRLTGGVRDYTLEAAKAGTPDVRATTWWGGASWYATPALTLTGAVYYVNVKNVAANTDADPVMYVARGLYALSKRTDLYVAAAYAKADNGKLVGLSRDDAGFGTTQKGLTAGIQHRF